LFCRETTRRVMDSHPHMLGYGEFGMERIASERSEIVFAIVMQ